jgi:ribonucleoside-diphosphate reductase alpha chain
MIKIVNNTVPGALFKLGYKESEVEGIVNYIDATGTIEGAPGIKPEHLAVFDCSFKPAKGTRSISWLGHVKMMAATQPFLSGAISKTVNLPNDCSVQDIADAYTESWKLGLKAVAIYRDGSKGTQPLNVTAQTSDEKKGTKQLTAAESATKAGAPDLSPLEIGAGSASSTDAATLSALALAHDKLAALELDRAQLETQFAALLKSTTTAAEAATAASDLQESQAPPRAIRHRLPSERASITHKFGIAGHEGYITVGLYPNGAPGEIFVRMAKEGSTISGLMDSFATAVSMCLQHGVPLKLLCEKFAHTRFEPSGWTGNEQIGYAKSIMDYLFRWMQLRFLSGTQLDLFANLKPEATVPVEGAVTAPHSTVVSSSSVILNEGKDPRISSATEAIPEPHTILGEAFERNDRTPPSHGIAPDLSARSGVASPSPLKAADRGLYHAASAMSELYDMGDSPSCSTCGSIMTRNGSCYRCMECGSTSGCS